MNAYIKMFRLLQDSTHHLISHIHKVSKMDDIYI